MRAIRAAAALALGASLTCLGTGCGGGSSASDEGKAAAAAFLDEIRAGRVEPAWQATTVEFKSLMGLGSLKDYVKTHPALKGQAEFLEGRAVGPTLAEYRFRATAPPNPKAKGKAKAPPAPATIRVTTAAEGGVAKVERLALE